MKSTRREIIQFVSTLLVMAVILHFLGRIPWCACGQFSLWSGDINSPHNSQHLLDAYSFSHFQHGLFFFFVFWLVRRDRRPCLLPALILEAGWEILENTPLIIERYRAGTISLNYYGDSIFNSAGDLLACAFGFFLAAKLPWKLMLAIYLAIEVVMLLLIRDSLTLNVIMLVHPVDVIRKWQM